MLLKKQAYTRPPRDIPLSVVLTPEFLRNRLIDQEETVYELAKELKCSRTSINYYVEKYGIDLPHHSGTVTQEKHDQEETTIPGRLLKLSTVLEWRDKLCAGDKVYVPLFLYPIAPDCIIPYDGRMHTNGTVVEKHERTFTVQFPNYKESFSYYDLWKGRVKVVSTKQ
jgi:hypothetical protein